tara:strand:- start:5536 stop:7806 length:2271 start_codon:yes stop_codon:yes gene_type:complete
MNSRIKSLIVISLLVSFAFTQESGTVFGYVYDEQSREGLPGTNVYLYDTEFGTATDIDGYFVISGIPKGEYEFIVSFLGYVTQKHSLIIRSSEKIKKEIELTLETVELQSVEVSAERIERKVNFQTSRVRLNMRQMKSVSRLGEADLMRSLQSLPGVLTETEFSTGLVIRGGNTDQNLILLDGITVYNPSHLGGVFSNFIMDAVKEADLLKGGFNAEYGGRLSAVLNVRSREGNQKKFTGKTSISLISAKTTLEGPLGKGAWLASARRTYFDWVFKGTEIYFPYYFYDLQGHIFQDITKNDRISISWYTGLDNLSWDEFLINTSWGNKTFSLNYRKLFNEKLVSHWMLATSRFDILFGLGGGGGINEEDFIKDRTLRSDWTYFYSQKRQFKWGIELKDLSFQYRATFMDSIIFNTEQTPLEGAAYLKMKRWFANRIIVESGLRMMYYSNHQTNWYFDPRLSIKFLLTEDRYINFSTGIYHQFMEAIQDDYYPKILDAWFAIDRSVYPASATQTVLGFEEYFGSTYRIQVETYYKTMENMMTFVDTRSTVDEIVSDSVLSDLVILGDGYAYGAELFFQKEYGKLNGWVAYSYSVSKKILKEKEYYTNWDRSHAFNIVANYQINNKWDMNLRWTWQSGQPYTPIHGYYIQVLPFDSDPFYRPIPGERNSDRYPNYDRLDFGAVRHFSLWGLEGDFFIQIINAYWKKNVFRYLYHFGDTQNGIDDDGDKEIDEDDEGVPQKMKIDGFPIVPTIGVTFEF